mmetsp:Transcript_23321/g.32578  ORF Transcript_23321/g.32578 Transcript_23321/m.32578 type:complete len:350 (+) Transcript_23321:168-1217(+)
MVDAAVIISWVGFFLLIPLLAIAEHRVVRSKGRVMRYHLYFAGVTLVGIFLLPSSAKHSIYSPLGVLIIGTVFPIYESIRAVCTPGGEDDKSWLMYWVAFACVEFPSAWVDDLAEEHQNVYDGWYSFEFFFFLWLLLPWTDGACILYDFIGKPFCAPLIKPIAAKCDNMIAGLVSAVMSASHLWFLWGIFLFFPPTWKRFLTVSVGVVYPFMASLVALTTEDTYDDDTFWLTYWSCYGCLYLMMDFLETWIGRIPGFYTIVLFSSVYLMLPIMRGAEKVFRNILVPLAGLQEMLLVRDALVVKKEMMKQLTPEQASKVKKVVAESFGKADDDDDEENDPLLNYGSVNVV